MLDLVVNGITTQCDACSLEEFLTTRNYSVLKIAVAVNETFIPKTKYKNLQLKNGDKIELVTPMQGG